MKDILTCPVLFPIHFLVCLQGSSFLTLAYEAISKVASLKYLCAQSWWVTNGVIMII